MAVIFPDVVKSTVSTGIHIWSCCHTSPPPGEGGVQSVALLFTNQNPVYHALVDKGKYNILVLSITS